MLNLFKQDRLKFETCLDVTEKLKKGHLASIRANLEIIPKIPINIFIRALVKHIGNFTINRTYPKVYINLRCGTDLRSVKISYTFSDKFFK